MPPKRIILHELRMLPPVLRAAYHIGIQHPALDSEVAFGEMLPGMAELDGRPEDVQLLEAGTERDKHLRMVADDCVGGSPLEDRLMEDLDNPGEILPFAALSPNNRPAVAVEKVLTASPTQPIHRHP
jgi:hypothetical protein